MESLFVGIDVSKDYIALKRQKSLPCLPGKLYFALVSVLLVDYREWPGFLGICKESGEAD